MNKSLLAVCCLLFLAACTSSQFSMYAPKNSEKQWNITASKPALSPKISVAVNDSVVVVASIAAFSNTCDAKGMYRGHEVHCFAVYNNGIIFGIGAGWETTVLVDNELAARFKL
jgi:hypothetical protein